MDNFKDIGEAITQKVMKAIRSSDVVRTLEVEAIKSVSRNFKEEGRPKWIPSQKKQKDPGLKTLTDSGDMSLIQAEVETSDSEVAVILTPGPNSRAYARLHHEGGVINVPARSLRMRERNGRKIFAKRKHKRVTEVSAKAHTIRIPARPYLVIPPEDYQGILNAVAKAIVL